MTASEWLMLFVLSLVWGGSFLFGAVAVSELPPITVAFVRVSGAALMLWCLLCTLGYRVPCRFAVWQAFFIMGLLNNVVPFSLIFWAQTDISAGLASILNATTPIFTVLVAHGLTTDERLTPARAAGVLLGFAGVVVIFGGQIGTGSGPWPLLAVLCAAVSYAVASVFGKCFAGLGVEPIVTAAGQVTASSVLLLPVMLFLDQPWALGMPAPAVLWSLAGLVLLSTALAYVLFFRILATAGATNLMLVTLLIPVSAVLLGVIILSEVVSLHQIAGLLLIALGLVVTDGRIPGKVRG